MEEEVHREQEKEITGDLEKCKHCGRKGQGKSPKIDLKKASCPAFDQGCKQFSRKGQYQDICTWKKDPKKERSEDSKKTTASGNQVEYNRMEMTRTTGKVLGVSQNHQKLMKKQQNMTKLRHELRMNVDILAYAKHRPPFQCTGQDGQFGV